MKCAAFKDCSGDPYERQTSGAIILYIKKLFFSYNKSTFTPVRGELINPPWLARLDFRLCLVYYLCLEEPGTTGI